jgi:hypothetical protein
MNPDFQEIRKLFERRYRRRLLFVLHFIAFMIGVAAMVSWLSTRFMYAENMEYLWFLAGWGVILFVHWLFYSLANRHDREIEAIWERLYSRATSDDEPEQKFKPAPNRLLSYDANEVQDEWVEEKPMRTLREE